MGDDATLLAQARLSGFDPRRTPVLDTDVLVIGGGLAGATAAMAAADAGRSVLLLSKTPLLETNTAYAQGGIAAVLAPDDDLELHLADTLRVGSGLCDLAAARHFIARGPDAVAKLEGRGATFDREDGGYALGREGGHSVHRVLHAEGTRTGLHMQQTLIRALLAHPGIIVREHTLVTDLVVVDGRCVGATAVGNEREPTQLGIAAGAVILATGGAGQIYRETTNPIGACADGIAMAYRAGATVRDLEFVQFHPTTLYIAGASRFLISEVVRGAGAVLRDRNGDRVMVDQHPLGDLAPRDVVSRAILERMVELGDTHVYLDVSPVDDPLRRFPEVARICAAFDIDIARQPIPVRPGAHYMIGGVTAEVDGTTDLPGLFAIGETASTGFHGANRLASNSLLEAAVSGADAGRSAAAQAAGRVPAHLPHIPDREIDESRVPRIHLDDVLYSLKSLMWRQVGLIRTGAGLADARERIDLWGRYILRASPRRAAGFELMNMLSVAGLIARAADVRLESRGTHYRQDHPARNDRSWCRHVGFRRAGGTMPQIGPPQVPSDSEDRINV